MPTSRLRTIGLTMMLLVTACDASDRHFDNAVVAFETKNFRGAVTLLTYAIDSGNLDDEKLARAYKLRGTSYLFIGFPFRAAADMERAIALNPADVDLRHTRAVALVRTGDYGEALREMNKAVELNPGDSLGHSNRCDILRLMRRYVDALADCDRAIELEPAFAPPWMERAKLHWDMGDDAAARSDILRAQQLWPDHPRIRQLAERYGAAAQ